MSCCPNNCGCGCDPCNGNPVQLQQCGCPDPGMVTQARYLQALDYKMCERRVQNPSVNSVLVNSVSGSGQSTITWTTQPCVLYPELEVAQGVAFGNIVGALGDLGCHVRIVPDAAATGFLQALNGEWVISPVPNATIPDPLSVNTLNVAVLATIADEVITGTLEISNPTAGTITQTIGLDVNNMLVVGALQGFQVAVYYENATLTSALLPNNSINRSAYAQIGNEISDVAGLAHVQTSQTIQVDTAGTYLLYWQGSYLSRGSGGTPSIHLVVNGAVVAYPNGRAPEVNTYVGVQLTGLHLSALAVNDTVQIVVNASAALTANLLRDVKLILIKIA